MNPPLESWRSRLREVRGIGVLVRAIEKSAVDHAKDMAASIAYFSFFSLFPLLVGIVAGASIFLERAEIQGHLDRLLSDEFPGSADFLRTNIAALVDLRGAASIASIVGLFWSASRMFGALSRGVNLALGVGRDRPRIVLSKLRHFAMTLLVSALLLAAVVVSMTIDVAIQVDLPRLNIDTTAIEGLGGHVTSVAVIFVVVLALFLIVPHQRPGWREAVPGALAAAVLFEAGKALFVLYLEQARGLRAVYGSLTSVIVLLLWLYFSARVLLFGAEVMAVSQDMQDEAQRKDVGVADH